MSSCQERPLGAIVQVVVVPCPGWWSASTRATSKRSSRLNSGHRPHPQPMIIAAQGGVGVDGDRRPAILQPWKIADDRPVRRARDNHQRAPLRHSPPLDHHRLPWRRRRRREFVAEAAGELVRGGLARRRQRRSRVWRIRQRDRPRRASRHADHDQIAAIAEAVVSDQDIGAAEFRSASVESCECRRCL